MMNVTDFEQSRSQLERCRELVAAINEAAERTGAYEQQREWTNPAGMSVYGDKIPSPAAVTPEFLTDIPRQSFFFTGWNPPPEPLALGPLARLAWRFGSAISPRAAFLALARLRHPACMDGPPPETRRALWRSFAAGLPVEYALGRDFDGTELDRVATQERLCALYHAGILEPLRAAAHPVILEIGAGYGALARAIKRIVPHAIYRIVDLPNSLALSGCYLTSRGVSGVEFALPTQLDRFDVPPIDLAINTLSFGEMPAANVDAYGAFIARNLAPGGRLFEQNFDNTHCARPNFCDPAAALRRHLVCERELRGFWIEGRPRIWAVRS